MIINPNAVIGDCLETAFGLPTYLELINEAKKAQFATADYRKKYNAYYRVRQRGAVWYDKYYELMENQRNNNLTFEMILRQLLPFGALEVSFSSKLLSTIDTQKPIWDQYVLKSLHLFDEWKSYAQLPQEERLQKAVCIYERIENWYDNFLRSQVGKECISKFDKELPQYSKVISNTKKIDFMLVSKALNIDSFRNLSKSKIVEFVSSIPLMDKEVATAIVNQFPNYSQTVSEMIDHLKDICQDIIHSNNQSSIVAAEAYQKILEDQSTMLKRDDLTFSERQQITSTMMDVANKIAELDAKNKLFLLNP